MKHALSSTKFRSKYELFTVASEADNYRLGIGGYHGNAKDRLANHDGRQFSTLDKDNDFSKDKNCAKINKGGWWYNACQTSNLNGLYPSEGDFGGEYMSWFDIGGLWQNNKYGGITYSQMAVEWRLDRTRT